MRSMSAKYLREVSLVRRREWTGLMSAFRINPMRLTRGHAGAYGPIPYDERDEENVGEADAVEQLSGPSGSRMVCVHGRSERGHPARGRSERKPHAVLPSYDSLFDSLLQG